MQNVKTSLFAILWILRYQCFADSLSCEFKILTKVNNVTYNYGCMRHNHKYYLSCVHQNQSFEKIWWHEIKAFSSSSSMLISDMYANLKILCQFLFHFSDPHVVSREIMCFVVGQQCVACLAYHHKITVQVWVWTQPGPHLLFPWARNYLCCLVLICPRNWD